MWDYLRDRRFEGLKFRRQVPLGRFIVDFACLERRIILEFDWPFHDADADAQRDAWLRRAGYRVLRFANADVQSAPDKVLDGIRRAVGLPSRLEGPLNP